MNYAQMHLRSAVAALVTEEGRIKERLCSAARSLLDGEMNNFDQIPPGLQADYKTLCQELTAVQHPKLGSIEATVNGLSDWEASNLAGRILALFEKWLESP